MTDIELKSFPFDSMKVLNESSGELEDDRLYAAQVFRDYFRKFLSNGVYFGNYKNYGENSMKVSLDIGLTIKVAKGCGIIEGVDYENESDQLITLERPASGNRVDRIVVQMNSSLDTRKSKLIVKQGNGTIPAELTRTDNIYEICIAEVTVKSTSNIADEDIVDTRLDTNLCGIVNSLISVDGEELYQRFQEYVRSVEENMMLKNEDIVDNLTSSAVDKALSAKQGKILNDSKADKKDVYTKNESDKKYKLKENFAFIGGLIDKSYTGAAIDTKNYPDGFNRDNCMVISIGISNTTISSGEFTYGGDLSIMPEVKLTSNNIQVKIDSQLTGTYEYRIALMKL